MEGRSSFPLSLFVENIMEHNFTWKNDGRLKIMIVCGTRPEIIRLAAVIKRCREYFDTCVVYTNQNWDKNLSTVFWEDFELKTRWGSLARIFCSMWSAATWGRPAGTSFPRPMRS